jgi:hypothetical protein
MPARHQHWLLAARLPAAARLPRAASPAAPSATDFPTVSSAGVFAVARKTTYPLVTARYEDH